MPLFMVWRGSLGDTGLWWSQTGNGVSWAPRQRVYGAESMEKPSLAAWRGLLYMAWRSVERGQALWWAVYDGRGWSGPRPVPGAGSSHGPSLVARPDRLHLYWKGAGGDERLWHGTFDGRFWTPGQTLFDGWSVTASRPSATTTHTTDVWLAFTGAGRDRSIRLCSSPDGSTWSRHDIVAVPEAVSAWPSVVGQVGAGPTDRLLVAWPDRDGCVRCAVSPDAARHWSRPAAVPARTLRGIGFAAWGAADAYAVWAVGPHDDHSIYWADTAGSTSWRDPHTDSPLRPGLRRIGEWASLREPALAAYGDMWR
ncbi:hypothetical protein [Streptomyces sp. NPDC059788]|uniref:hypothetical protein n=1 Tax=Streptomyces sp. NPDC059788 TaxID=3346948 RepID=UPI003656350F